MKKLFVGLTVVLAATGCQSYHPLPVVTPTKANYDSYQEAVATDIPIPKTLAEARQYAWTFGEVYRQRKNKLRVSIYNHSDAGFLGAVVGLIGGIAKAPDWAAGGAAFAAGAEIGPSRYQLSVQAVNFENAEKAATCVYDELRKIDATQEANLAAFGPAGSDNSIGELTRLTFKRLHAKLEDAQSKVTLASPDLTKLQKSLEELKAATAKKGILTAPTPAQLGAALSEELTKKFETCLDLFPSGG